MAFTGEDTDNPLVSGSTLGHQPPENIRKLIYLATVGKYATADKAERAAHTIGDEDTQRYAAAWEDVMLDFPASDLTFDTTPPFPTEEDDNLKLPGIDPGDLICFFERSFTHALLGAVKTVDDYEFKFAATEVTKDAIYNDNSTPVDIDGAQETWNVEEDDFRPGTPFVISGAPDPANDGFYRVRSVRSEASGVYVIADDNEYNQQDLVETGAGGQATCDFDGDWYALRGGNGNSEEQYNTDGGKMNDYFAELGDSVYERPVADTWWTPKDKHKRYPDTGGNVTYGPNDGRPPTGGQMSKDFNGDWVRTRNPSRYHDGDENSHTFFVKSETDGSQPPDPGGDYEQFTSLIPTSDFLCFQPDPREIRVPFRFEDTARTKFKYDGKVPFGSAQITDADNLGALSAVQRAGTIAAGPTATGQSSHSQYKTAHVITLTSGTRAVLGNTPLVAGHSVKDSWINNKYSNSLQNAVEMAVSDDLWMAAPDDDYETNWIDLNGADPILMVDTSGWSDWDSGTTYGDGAEVRANATGRLVYVSIQAGNLNHAVTDTAWWRKYTFAEALADFDLETAWQPILNPGQPFYTEMSDELWGENGSAFELLLKFLGANDWYYDPTFPFRSKRVLDDGFEWWNNMTVAQQEANYPLPATYNGIACTTSEDVINAFWRIPHGVYRRTWKYSLGQKSGVVYQDGDLPDPTFEDYDADISGFNAEHPDTGDPLKMYGHLRMNDPGETNDDAAIAIRHGASYEINDHDIFADNIRLIVADCRAVMDLLRYLRGNIDITMIEKLSTDADESSDISWEDARVQYEDSLLAAEPDLVDYAAPVFPETRGQSQFQVQTRYRTTTPIYRYDGGNRKYVGVKLTLPDDEVINLGSANGNGRKVQVVLKSETINNHYDANGDLIKPAGVDQFEGSAFVPGIKGLVDVACLSDNDFYYGIGVLNPEDALIVWDAGNNRYDFSYKLTHLQYFHYDADVPPSTNDYVIANNSNAWVEPLINDSAVVEFEWDGFDLEIFDRDWERADYHITDFLA